MGKPNDLTLRVEAALEEIRPFLASDGGGISLIEITDDKVVKVKLHGSCVDCSVNQMTLKNGIEMIVKRHASEITEVLEVGQTPNSLK